MAEVLVTGGSGFIGSWCVIGLLKAGHVVRTTVRDLAKEPAVRAAIGRETDPGNRLAFHAVDLLSDDGWDAAAAGCDYVLHVASPIGAAEPKDPDVLIRPACEGATRAVNAAIKAGVKRVVLTSSVAATSLGSGGGDWVCDETQWTVVDGPKWAGAYVTSKTLAEKTAWELIGASDGATELATVNPALVLGPVLSSDFSDSVTIVSRLLTGRVPGLPGFGFNVVDVRDVADLHIRAMTDPAASGERFIAAGQYAWMADLATILRAKLPPSETRKVPTRKLPNLMVHFAALFDRDLTFLTPNLGCRHDYTSAKAQRVLGWKPRPLEETVVETARSLIDRGALA